jgi:hypothetical protein
MVRIWTKINVKDSASIKKLVRLDKNENHLRPNLKKFFLLLSERVRIIRQVFLSTSM